MGLFTNPEDGSVRGWLAAFMCCWTAGNEGDWSAEPARSQSVATAGVCLEQPAPLRRLPSFPTVSNKSRTSSWNVCDDDKQSSKDTIIPARPLSEIPPSLKPLDFGDNTFFAKPSMQAHQKDSTPRPLIGTPTDFRRIELTEGQRNSLIPLKLAPVVLRGPSDAEPSRNSLVYDDSVSKLTDSLTSTPVRHSYPHSLATSNHRRDSPSVQDSPKVPPPTSDEITFPMPCAERRFSRPTLSTQSSSASMRSLRQRTLNSVASSTPSLSSFDRNWLQRKRSSQSFTKSVYEIDREILELNTIVEERRTEAALSFSPSDHVPAIAPSMPVRARSKTLSDIGSAFSKPAVSHSATTARLSRPFMPDLFGPEIIDPVADRPATAHATSGTKARVSGWISGFLRSSSSTRLSAQEPFYKCNPASMRPTVSTGSLCTLVTDMESPCLTMASSPASKTHSRTLTSESRPLSVQTAPIMRGHATCHPEQDEMDPWPLVTDDADEVGIAL